MPSARNRGYAQPRGWCRSAGAACAVSPRARPCAWRIWLVCAKSLARPGEARALRRDSASRQPYHRLDSSVWSPFAGSSGQ
jgi:hypothetical protein